MSITGEMPIGVLAARLRQGVARALSFAVNAEIEPDFALGGAMEVARADSYGRTSLVDRVVSLERISPTFSKRAL
jgi:2,5-dioxopentanoate dehydrogenase